MITEVRMGADEGTGLDSGVVILARALPLAPCIIPVLIETLIWQFM